MRFVPLCSSLCLGARTMAKAVLARCCLLTRKQVVALVTIFVVLPFIVFSRSIFFQPFEVGIFTPLPSDLARDLSAFKPPVTPLEGQGSGSGQALRHFKRVDDQEIFLYSAIANHQEPTAGEINLIITAFDSTGTDSGLGCCVVLQDNQLYVTSASVFYKQYIEPILGPVLEVFKNAPTKAKQYACVVPRIGHNVSHVTLTSASCPTSLESYLPVVYPEVVPGGLAICAKAAYGHGLDPNKLMEWFEVQRLLGIDRIQVMDLDNPEPIQKVFRYYIDMGLLILVPYQLPGKPYGRGLHEGSIVSEQMTHDETFPIIDCRQRLAGHDYVLGHDLDEVIVPWKEQSLKELFKEQFRLKPDAAGFFFYTRFFLYDWGPVDPESDVTYFRFLNSTQTRDECKKYVYLPGRVAQARIHTFYPRASYRQYFMDENAAILHHYRNCPGHWPTCQPAKVTDRTMLRFRGQLDSRLEKARQATGIKPAS